MSARSSDRASFRRYAPPEDALCARHFRGYARLRSTRLLPPLYLRATVFEHTWRKLRGETPPLPAVESLPLDPVAASSNLIELFGTS